MGRTIEVRTCEFVECHVLQHHRVRGALTFLSSRRRVRGGESIGAAGRAWMDEATSVLRRPLREHYWPVRTALARKVKQSLLRRGLGLHCRAASDSCVLGACAHAVTSTLRALHCAGDRTSKDVQRWRRRRPFASPARVATLTSPSGPSRVRPPFNFDLLTVGQTASTCVSAELLHARPQHPGSDVHADRLLLKRSDS